MSYSVAQINQLLLALRDKVHASSMGSENDRSKEISKNSYVEYRTKSEGEQPSGISNFRVRD